MAKQQLNKQRRDQSQSSKAAKTTSFRRGQTISGYQKEHSERLKTHELVVRRRKLGWFFSFVLIMAALVLFTLAQLVVSTSFTLSSGQIISDGDKYAKIINDYYHDHPIERLLIFMDGNNLLAQLQAAQPEIRAIKQIRMTSLTSFNFELEVRQPVALWEINDKKYFVDDQGVPFVDNYFEAPSISVLDESGLRVDIDTVVASSSFLGFIGRAVGQAQRDNVQIERIVIPALSLRQVDVYLKDRNYPVNLLTSNSPEAQIEGLASALRYFDDQGIAPNYIDLRAEGRAYYRF